MPSSYSGTSYVYTAGDNLSVVSSNSTNPLDTDHAKYWAAIIRYWNAMLLDMWAVEHVNATGAHKAGFLTTAMIGALQVTAAKIAAGAVGATQIASASITTAQISATAGITGNQLANGAVDTAQLSAGVQAQLGSASGQMFLIASLGAQTGQTANTSSQNAGAYSLGNNTYSKIIVDADVEIQSSGTKRTGQVTVKIGSQTGQVYAYTTSGHSPDSGVMRVSFDAAQTTAATIAIAHNWTATDAGTAIQVVSFRIYGVI